MEPFPVGKREDGRQCNMDLVERYHHGLIEELRSKPRIYGPSAQLKLVGKEQRAALHIQAMLGPDVDEIGVWSLVTCLAGLGDSYARSHKVGIRGVKDSDPKTAEAWGLLFMGVSKLLEHIPLGRFDEGHLLNLVTIIFENEESKPADAEAQND